MFLTGVLIGSALATAACLLATVARLMADQAGQARLQPALVPLHVSRATPVSMN